MLTETPDVATTLVATTDFHSSVPDGLATLEALARLRDTGSLLVDAGDFYGGNAFHEFSQGRYEEEIAAGLFHAMVPGNHDFADLQRLREPKRYPPVVCANVIPPDSFPGRWEPGLLLPERGPRVGVVGFIGAQAFTAVPAEERAGFTFKEPTPALLAAEHTRLRVAGADVVIGVSHTGLERDIAFQTSGESPFDTIVAGHCHCSYYQWSDGGRHVVKAPELGAGLLRIGLRGDGTTSFTVEHHRGPASAAGPGSHALTPFRAWGDTVLGTLPEPIGDRTELAHRLCERARTATRADAFLLNLAHPAHRPARRSDPARAGRRRPLRRTARAPGRPAPVHRPGAPRPAVRGGAGARHRRPRPGQRRHHHLSGRPTGHSRRAGPPAHHPLHHHRSVRRHP
ncbi:metallophosphoesterase [Kitasatospora aureofaciens]|uniref:metallophosphoesterase n=1 Tax=Kitasatospora aureofaciens TaxID=1894 RepID=UPI001C48A5BE|nr:metallophosphoesterase [Kitasatospora aureofaciens]MBV6702766.1 metallophosphoesterase [Kitasatospora aureofaciens]